MAGSLLAAPETTVPDSYVLRMNLVVEACRASLSAMQEPAEEAARRLASGGKLWAAGQPSMVSELTGRAGGIMMIRALGDNTPEAADVVLWTAEPGVSPPTSWRDSKAQVVVIGEAAAPYLSNHAEPSHVSPTLANAVPAWTFTGELIAALTRLGKMPVMYETIGGYGGFARIEKYKRGELAFHDDVTVPPVPPGVIGARYLDALSAKLKRVEAEERAALDKTGAWLRDARQQEKHIFLYCMGHQIPDEVKNSKIGAFFPNAVWNAGFRQPHPQDTYAPGDVAVQIGYQHPADELLRLARPAGARVAYVSVRPDRDFTHDPEVVWIDPMWDWLDGCVSVEGYDIPILPASSVLNGAIVWELYRLASGEETP